MFDLFQDLTPQPVSLMYTDMTPVDMNAGPSSIHGKILNLFVSVVPNTPCLHLIN